MTEDKEPQYTTINFFDGTSIKTENESDEISMENIIEEIVWQKKVKRSTIQIFVLGNEEPLTEYNEEPLLFCLFKEVVEIIIKNTYEQYNEIREEHYQQVGLVITELIEDRYDKMEDCNVYKCNNIDELTEWVNTLLADERFNSKGCDKIFKNDNDVFGANAPPYNVMFEFEEIKEYIEEELEYDDKITHSNYRALYEYALAREWCVNVEISTTQEEKEADNQVKNDIENPIIKKMYWDVDELTREEMDEQNSIAEEDTLDDESLEDKTDRIYKKTFEKCIEHYTEMMEDMTGEDLVNYLETAFEMSNVVVGLRNAADCPDRLRKVIFQILGENDEFKQNLYDKYI